MYRHGDILIAPIDAIPQTADLQANLILAHGEVTGHTHRIAETDGAKLYRLGTLLFLHVLAEGATLVHDEHRPIALPPGTYRVWPQREYTPARIRTVVD